jgi:hypothetical protein
MRTTRDQSIQNLMNRNKDTGTHPPSSQQQRRLLECHIGDSLYWGDGEWKLWSLKLRFVSEYCSLWSGNMIHVCESKGSIANVLHVCCIRTRTEDAGGFANSEAFSLPAPPAVKVTNSKNASI